MIPDSVDPFRIRSYSPPRMAPYVSHLCDDLRWHTDPTQNEIDLLGKLFSVTLVDSF